MKKTVQLMILIAAFFVIAASAFAEITDQAGTFFSDFSVRINPYGGKAADPETLSLFLASESRTSYDLFLPADTIAERTRIWITDDSKQVEIDGNTYKNGDCCPLLAEEGRHVITVSGELTNAAEIIVYKSKNIPAVFLNTESGTMDYIHEKKGNKESGRIIIHENGSVVADVSVKQIKGRGNLTWEYNKKPYSIKLNDPADLLGMGESKKWIFLANAIDPSMLRNSIAWNLADLCELPYTPDWRHVDLYENGRYLGNYVICEGVGIEENRVDIRDLEKENEQLNGDLSGFPQVGSGKDGSVLSGSVKGSLKWADMPVSPEDVTGGYLMELDYESRYDEEISGFVTGTGQCVVIKSPELASGEEIKYISSLVNEADYALYSPTGTNELGKHYTDYYDLNSMVSMYFIREFGNDIDAGLSSVYMVKKEGENKLIFAPLWDMDRAFGDHIIRFGTDYGDPSIWWANSLFYYIGTNQIPTVFNAAFRHQDFRAAVREKWTQLRNGKILETLDLFINEQNKKLSASAVMDAVRWNTYDTKNNEVISAKYNEACNQIKDFLKLRADSLDRGFSEDAIMLYYDGNGGKGSVINTQILTKGDAVFLLGSVQGDTWISPPAGDMIFSHWNTKADGTGMDLYPKDRIVLQEDTVLYAVWRERPVITALITEVAENGDELLNLTKAEMEAAGFAPGDLVSMRIGGYVEKIPYYTGRYAVDGQTMLCALGDQDNIALTMNGGSVFGRYVCQPGTEVIICLEEEKGVETLQQINNLDTWLNRIYNQTDEMYVNFRSVSMGSIGKGKLYRSANPLFANDKGEILQELMKREKILTVMNMSYEVDELLAAFDDESFSNTYYKSLYDAGSVFSERQAFDYKQKDYAGQMVRGFSFLADHDPPYLLHCMGGRDRTGFATLLLEMLAGADRDEMIRDYMLTYTNYYGIHEGTEAYDLLKERTILPMLDYLKNEYAAENSQDAARNYLLDNGMDEEKLDLLMRKLQ